MTAYLYLIRKNTDEWRPSPLCTDFIHFYQRPQNIYIGLCMLLFILVPTQCMYIFGLQITY